MAEDQTHTGGAQGAGGGVSSNGQNAGNNSSGGTNDENKGTPKTVSWENHQRALSDLHKFKKQVDDLGTKLGDMESQSLKEKQDFKSLYERETEKRKAAEEEVKKVKGWAVSTHRFAEIKSEAMKAGLLPNALSDLELIPQDNVEVEVTSTGRFLVNGAKDFVENIKKDRPHWFQNPKAPNVNSGGGGAAVPSGGSELSAHDVYQAERSWKAGKITRKQYEETHMRFRTQKAVGKK